MDEHSTPLQTRQHLSCNPSGSDQAIERQDLVAQIDAEIARQREERQSPGWSPWALWGAFGILLWTALGTFPFADWMIVAQLALAGEAMYFAVSAVADFLSPNPKDLLGLRRFGRFGAHIAVRRRWLALACLYYSIAVYLLAVLPDLGAVARAGGIALFAAAALVDSCLLLVSALPVVADSVVPAHRDNKHRMRAARIAKYAAPVLVPGVPFLIGTGLLPPTPELSRPILQAAVLIVGIVRISFRLSSSSMHSPILSALHDLRGEVFRGRMNLDRGRVLLDSLVGGLTTHQLVQERAVRWVELCNMLTALLHRARSRLEYFGDGKPGMTALNAELCQALLDAFQTDLNHIESLMKSLKETRKGFER